ncbi:Transcriptional regulatory protein rprY [Fulvivirga imtechensis AK7]|uniref:Transcriptional regulatory protein rprY n=1 Tax=Fulvivirga imtechensis AK7 TaxID=1237149 RepID=L8JNS6_9BACT|nr:response regulator transcription factor [Fulvivirga imtechensis]ELR69818.1 Transcriptional regulatory protein rprY [Fulvivirga imtechensis AK7]
MPEKRILLVEDDQNLGFVIEDNLSISGYSVTRCYNGEEGLEACQNSRFDLCILDVMLPKKDGFTLAREIRAFNQHIPILFLTAKSMQEDKLEGFRTGADDYITKPFSMEELMYRMQVFLKRTGLGSEKPATTTYQVGAYLFDYGNLTLTNGDFHKDLTQKEADVLRYFCNNKDVIVRREDILREVWGDDDYFLGRSMDVFISKLRKYLKQDPAVEIINYHGIGFKFQIKI